MVLRNRWKNRPSREIMAIGMTCLWVGVLLGTAGSVWIKSPPFLSGFLMGLAGVLLGLSIVVNIAGLKRHRAERAGS